MSFPFAARGRPAPAGLMAAFAGALLAATATADAETLKIGARSFDFALPAGLCVVDPQRAPSERSARLNLSSAGAGVKTAIVFADCRQLADWRGDPTRRITRFGTIAYDGEQLGSPAFADPSDDELSAFLNDAAETFRVTAGALPDTYLQGEFPKHASSFVAIDHLTGVGLAGRPVVADDMFKSYVAASVVAGEQEVRFGKANGATIFAGTIVVVGIADRIAGDGDMTALDDDMTRVVAALRAAAGAAAPAIAETADDLPAGLDLAGVTVRPTVSDIDAAVAAQKELPFTDGDLRQTLAAPVPVEIEPIAAADSKAKPEPVGNKPVVVEITDAPEETPVVAPAPQTAALTAPPAQPELPDETAETPTPEPVAAEAEAAAAVAAPQPLESVRRESPAPAVLVAPTTAPAGGLSAPLSAPGLAGPALVPAVTVVGQ